MVAEELERLGAAVIRADDVSRELLQPGSELLAEVVEEFGGGFLKADGSLDRRALGAAILDDDGARRRLEWIVHPAMVARMGELVDEIRRVGATPVTVIEAANLVEMGALALVDVTVMVTAPREERIRRLMRRDGIGRERAETLVKLHERMGIGEHCTHHVLSTNCCIDDTRRAAQRLWRELTERLE